MQGRTQSGLFQRFIYIWPERNAEDIDDYHVTDTEEERTAGLAWEREVTRIEHLNPCDLMWTTDAVEVYRQAKIEWMRAVRQYEMDSPDFASIINKMSIHLCRWSIVAAVLAGKVVIDGQVVDYAKRCCDIFMDNARKVYEYIVGADVMKSRGLTLGDIYKGLLDRFPNLTQVQLADCLGVTKQAIGNALKRVES